MQREEYEGVIVCDAPVAPTYEGEPRTRDQFYELAQTQLLTLLPRLVGKPVVTEHGVQPVGKITHAALDVKGSATVKFRFTADPVGENARMLVQKGILLGLSLNHRRDTLEPTEVSLCFQGARKNTGITGCNVVAASRTNEGPYKTRFAPNLPSVYVRASRVAVTPVRCVMATTPAPPTIALTQDELKMVQDSRRANNVAASDVVPPPATAQAAAPAAAAPAPQASAPAAPVPQESNTAMIPMHQAIEFAHAMAGIPSQQPQRQTIKRKQPDAEQVVPQTAPHQQQLQQGQEKKIKTEAAHESTGKAVAVEEDKSTDKVEAEADDEDVLDALLKHNGVNRTLKERLIDAMSAERKKAVKLQKELDKATSKLEATKGTAESVQQQFRDTVIPFMRQLLPQNQLTKSQEDAMERASRDEGAQQFLAAFAPPMVAASAAAMALVRHGRGMDTDDVLHKKVQLFRALQSTGDVPRANTMPAASAPVTAPMHQPQGAAHGWIPTAVAPQAVAASGLTQPLPAAHAVVPDPYAVSDHVKQLLESAPAGDMVTVPRMR